MINQLRAMSMSCSGVERVRATNFDRIDRKWSIVWFPLIFSLINIVGLPKNRSFKINHDGCGLFQKNLWNFFLSPYRAIQTLILREIFVCIKRPLNINVFQKNVGDVYSKSRNFEETLSNFGLFGTSFMYNV